VGVARPLEDQVANLSRLCADAGLDGVVASAQEVSLIRSAVNRPEFLIVTPGVRRAEGTTDDQKRVLTPAEAVRAGSDFLVVGRPITGSPDPVMATVQIIEDIQSSLPESAQK
jgi:orotidine-5'-phosphate decarboxylase